MLPVLPAAIGGVILWLVTGVVARVLVSLGLAVVTYIGLDYAFDYLKELVISALNQFPPEVVQLLALMRVGTALSILFSAMFGSLLLNGLTGGKLFKKWILT